jgi:hypothetical protein
VADVDGRHRDLLLGTVASHARVTYDGTSPSRGGAGAI